MKELLTRAMDDANEYCAKYGFIPAMWHIGAQYRYAHDPKEKAALHIIIKNLQKNPEAAPYLPKLPTIN